MENTKNSLSIKDSIFNLPITNTLLGLLAKSEKSHILLNEAFKDFTDMDWKNNKNALSLLICASDFTSPSKYNIDYNKLTSYFSEEQWSRYLKDTNVIMRKKLRDNFLSYLEKNQSMSLLSHFLEGEKIDNIQDYIAVLDKCKMMINKSNWANNLDILNKKEIIFGEKLEFIEKYNIDPFYSKDVFEKFFVNRVKLSTYSRTRGSDFGKVNFNSLDKNEFGWLMKKLSQLSNNEIGIFMNNKLGLNNNKDYIYKNKLLDIKKSLGCNYDLLQDYAYLIAFCNLLLNPSNKNYANTMALQLDDFLNHQMRDKQKPWWQKVQEIINNQDLRNCLTSGVKSDWIPIYEKIYLNNFVTSAEVSKKNRYKI